MNTADTLKDALFGIAAAGAIGPLTKACENLKAERDTLRAFAMSLLNPEENGWAVPAHIRDEARKALGRKPVETGGKP